MVPIWAGMILERLEGKPPNKTVQPPEFNDIHYLEEALFCIFNALDIGQKALGFHHAGQLLFSLLASVCTGYSTGEKQSKRTAGLAWLRDVGGTSKHLGNHC